ncbi:MAG: M1 family metallopeptidase [Gemmatimonadales bacterium]|nr:MAG: M1 family metallopeptidase [Gemmatimonadales bacterium]
MRRWTHTWWSVAWLGLLLPGPAGARQDWQQGVEYRIEARLNEASEQLEGFARVRYRNNSPRTLTEFYFHLYLNAFRPNSAWARKDLEYGIRTFQDLGSDEHGFERIETLAVDGEPVRPFYPFAPDSTIVGFRLPEPLDPGESVSVDVRWNARPSSVPRRQGRAGRQYDFAQWYPRVVVYDLEGWRTHPLYRAGEFYGEFATYDVTLELPRDQVIGATGVPVAGDPGWEAAAVPGTGPIEYQREWYGSLTGPPCIERAGERICGDFPARSLQREESLGYLSAEPRAGNKQVRWYAEDVHHFAWSTSPDYIVETGRWEDVAIRVLYRPGDESSWGGGIAVRRTAVALEWLDSIFGDYPYPQVTNLHRLEGGGTEFPMLIMDGSASQGLILHEVGHIYAHGILANNEWYEGWLDEGMSSFQTDWFNEVNGAGDAVWEGDRRRIMLMDLQGISEPVVMNAEGYAEQGVYSAMIYTKGSLVLWMLREMVGDETMVRILRTYYDRHRFNHVRSSDFQAVAEEVSGRDLDWFFGQWLHTTGSVDYALQDTDVYHARTGSWVRFTLRRLGEMRMPVPVRIEGAGNVKDTVVHGMDLERRLEIWTDFRPYRVVLDPEGRTLDWNPSNNEWTRPLTDLDGREVHFDNPLRGPRTALDHLPIGLAPLGWANESGGWVVGLQYRSSILGYSNTVGRIGLPGFEAGNKGDGISPGSAYLRLENPRGRRQAILGSTSEIFAGEGRFALLSTWENDLRNHPLSGNTRSVRATVAAVNVYDEAYLPPGRWSGGDRWMGEMGLGLGLGLAAAGLDVQVDAQSAAGFDTDDRRYFRGALSVDAVGRIAGGLRMAVRGFAGVAAGWDPSDLVDGPRTSFAPRERMFSLSSGDPLQQLGNPFLRSRGTGLEATGRSPGGGTLAGFDGTVPYPLIATLAVEFAGSEWMPRMAPQVRLRPIVFAGVGWAEFPPLALDVPPVDPDSNDDRWVNSAGVGVEFGLSDSPVRLRLDLPLWVSEPVMASSARDGEVGLRLQLGFRPPRWN